MQITSSRPRVRTATFGRRAGAWRRFALRTLRRAPAPWPLALCALALQLITPWSVALALTLVVWWVALPVASAVLAALRNEG